MRFASGEFKSILHLIIPDPKESGETHVEAEIPMSVKVHHDWPWPLGVLAAGVAIGMFFSWFKSTGKDRDTALVGRDGLVEIVDDPSRPALLVDALAPVTADIDDAIKRSDWAAAQAAVRKGEAIVFRWRRDRADWEDLSTYVRAFRAELQRYPQNSATIRKILDQLRAERGTLASAETSEPFRTRLNLWNEQLDRYRAVQDAMGALTRTRALAPPDLAKELPHEEEAFADRLNKLAPDETGGFGALLADINAAIERLLAADAAARAAGGIGVALGNPQVLEDRPKGLSSIADYSAPTWKQNLIPTINWLSLGRSLRLKAMGWLGYLFPAAVFVYTGLSQLYLANPIFGSLADYAALFLWGFGSDAGGSKLQDLMRQAPGGAKLGDITRTAANAPDGADAK